MNYEHWLSESLANLLEKPASQISTTLPLAELGVDSMVAVQMSGLIEDDLKIFVEPSTLYDHNSIAELAQFLEKSHAPGSISK